MNFFENKVFSFIKEYRMIEPCDKLVLGLSGGFDSVCLLRLLLKFKEKLDFSLVAAHINHCVRASAKEDENFVLELCRKHNIDCRVGHFDVLAFAKKKHISVEAAGRQIRYDFFNEVKRDCIANKIALAHNLNDNAETILLNLIRGSSLEGLKGILPVRGDIIRPLIETKREDIEKYLDLIGQKAMWDNTNDSLVYMRNIVRNQIVPMILKINPAFVENTTSFKKLVLQDLNFISSFVGTLDPIRYLEDRAVLSIDFIKNNPRAVTSRTIIKAYAHINSDTKDLEHKHIDIILNQSACVKDGIIATLCHGILVRAERGNLVFYKKQEKTDFLYKVDISRPVCLDEKKILFREISKEYFTSNEFDGMVKAVFDYNKLSGELLIRNRKNGDRFVPLNFLGTVKIKDFFTNEKVSNLDKDKIHLLTCNGEIAWIIGYRMSDRFKVDENTTRFLLARVEDIRSD